MNSKDNFKIMAKIALMNNSGRVAMLIVAMMFIVQSCADKPEKKEQKDTMVAGEVVISVDETYRPVIKEQLEVFDSSYPDAHIQVQYKSESECIKDLLDGSAKLILVTRDLTKDEKKVAETNKLVTTGLEVAKDAVAVILNKSNNDTTLGINQIKGILTGAYDKQYKVVFDNTGSSTLRYMMDSLIPGEQLAQNVYAAKGNDSVIHYVANTPDAIGFISVSYVSDYDDPEGLAFIGDVKVASIYNDSLEKSYKPYQAYIAPDWYPLTRKLYYVHSQTYPGLAQGFAKFLREQRGQLIFKQARMFPTRVNIIFRQAEVNN